MTTYYKATRIDGTDFRTGTVDYAATLGPNGPQVARMIEQARTLTEDQALVIKAARKATGVAEWYAARSAAWYAAWDSARAAAWDSARAAAWDPVWDITEDATRDAVVAALVRDLISDKHYQALAGPWESVMGPIFDDKEEA